MISAEDLKQHLDYASLIDAIDQMFKEGCTVPTRHHHPIETPGAPNPMLLLMPAWVQGDVIGVKIITVFPENGDKDLPAVMGSYMLMDGTNGTPLAMLDGPELTARRTASASAVASRYLSRQDSSTILMVGTGVLAPHLIRAHAAARPIKNVMIWGRDSDKAAAVVAELADDDFTCRVVTDLETAVPGADIISCATLARQPLVMGDWLVPGQHLDLVGAFTPEMRESDDRCVVRADLYCDTRDGATLHAGDFTDPIGRGIISDKDVLGDLFDLTGGRCKGRTGNDQITLFKSAGTALEDLAAAKLAVSRLDN